MSLDRLLKKIRACSLCERSKEGDALPHPARPIVHAKRGARILIVGQAPGHLAHERGLPFDDPSGQRLRAWMGVTRSEFYDSPTIAFAPMCFCFPGYSLRGSDLPPRKECAPKWQDQFLKELPYLELVLLIGLHAQRWYLEPTKSLTLSQIVERGPRRLLKPKGALGFPLPHPSWRNTKWLKLNPWFEKDVLPQLQKQVKMRLKPRPRSKWVVVE